MKMLNASSLLNDMTTLSKGKFKSYITVNDIKKEVYYLYTFEEDIEFMTKIIAGGLNKPKATGQTTIPVIPGQDARTGYEDISAWKKLAGI